MSFERWQLHASSSSLNSSIRFCMLTNYVFPLAKFQFFLIQHYLCSSTWCCFFDLFSYFLAFQHPSTRFQASQGMFFPIIRFWLYVLNVLLCCFCVLNYNFFNESLCSFWSFGGCYFNESLCNGFETVLV